MSPQAPQDANTAGPRPPLIGSEGYRKRPAPIEGGALVTYSSFFLFGRFRTMRLSVTEKTPGTSLARVRMSVSSN